MKRLFVAGEISDEVKTAIQKYQATLSRLPLRPTPIENLNLTLVFLGPTPEENISAIEMRIEKTIENIASPLMLAPEAFEPGADKRFPSFVWLALKPNEELARFQGALEKILTKKYRPFHPHITIARLRSNSRLYSDQVEEKRLEEDLPFQVKEIFLMESALKPTGAEYSILKRFSL